METKRTAYLDRHQPDAEQAHGAVSVHTGHGAEAEPLVPGMDSSGLDRGGCLGGGSGNSRSVLGEGLGTVASYWSGLQYVNAGADTAALAHTSLIIGPIKEEHTVLNSFAKDACTCACERTRRSLNREAAFSCISL